MQKEKKQYKSTADLPMWAKMLTGGLAGCVAEAATIPLDTSVGIINNYQMKETDGTYKYTGLLKGTKMIFQEEGILALYKGLGAGFQRQIIFASLRIGLYEPVRDFYCGKGFTGDPPLLKKIAAGLTTGAFAIAIANPTDVIKVRFQVDGNKPVHERRYSNLRHAYKTIWLEEGLVGFWRALVPNMLRNSIINAAELAAYDQVKQTILKYGLMQNNIWCHLTSSFLAGFFATVVGQPVDLIKTRIMNKKQSIGFIIMDGIKNDGIMSFYNGFSANAGRIISWNIVMFITLEQMRGVVFNQFYRSAQYE